MYHDLAAIKEAANDSQYSSRWFALDNFERFKTRVLDDIYPADTYGAFFISSDRPDPELPRVYTVHHIDADGNIRPMDGSAPVAPGVYANRIPTRVHARNLAQKVAAAVKLGVYAKPDHPTT